MERRRLKDIVLCFVLLLILYNLHLYTVSGDATFGDIHSSDRDADGEVSNDEYVEEKNVKEIVEEREASEEVTTKDTFELEATRKVNALRIDHLQRECEKVTKFYVLISCYK